MFYRPANIYRRIGAAIVDHLLVNLLLLGIYAKFFNLPINQIVIDQKLFIIFSLITFFYFFLLEYFFQKTIGKKIFNIEVRQASFRPINLWGAILRNLLRPIDFIGFYFLAMIVISLNGRSQRIGDLLGRTVVVQSV